MVRFLEQYNIHTVLICKFYKTSKSATIFNAQLKGTQDISNISSLMVLRRPLNACIRFLAHVGLSSWDILTGPAAKL